MLSIFVSLFPSRGKRRKFQKGEINFQQIKRKKRESEREEECKRDGTALGSQVHRFTRHGPGFSPGEKEGGKKRFGRSSRDVDRPAAFCISRDSSGRVFKRKSEGKRCGWEWRKWHHGSIEHGGPPARCRPRPFLFRAPASSPPPRKSERCVMFHLRETPRRFLDRTALLTTSKTFSFSLSLFPPPSKLSNPISISSNSTRDPKISRHFLTNPPLLPFPFSLPFVSTRDHEIDLVQFCRFFFFLITSGGEEIFSDCIVVRDKDIIYIYIIDRMYINIE